MLVSRVFFSRQFVHGPVGVLRIALMQHHSDIPSEVVSHSRLTTYFTRSSSSLAPATLKKLARSAYFFAFALSPARSNH